MLYVTTRDKRDAFTAHRAIFEEYGPDGGRYIPFSLPEFSKDEIAALKDKSFYQTVADVLNVFFSARLTGWDVEFCIGRISLHFVQMNHKIILAELWRNLDGQYAYIVRSLAAKICDSCGKCVVSDWLQIAVRIAVLFGVYGEMLRNALIDEASMFDISLQHEDFSAPMAAWYARKLGLPVGTIICTGIEDSAVWDFLHKGTFNPAGTKKTLRDGLERLITATFGPEEAVRFATCCQDKKAFSVTEEQLPLLNDGFFVTVAGEKRAFSTVNSIYRSNSYVVDPDTALCFGGIQDFRTKFGESKLTLLLSEDTPMHHADGIMNATGLSKDALEKILNP